jgi:hypothetical protein
MTTIIGITSIAFLIKVLALSRTQKPNKLIESMKQNTGCYLLEI